MRSHGRGCRQLVEIPMGQVPAQDATPPVHCRPGGWRAGSQPIALRQGMTPGAEPAGRIDDDVVGWREEHGVPPDRRADEPALDDAAANGGRGLVTGAGGDGKARRQPEFTGNGGAQATRNRRALLDIRQPGARNLERIEDFARPGSPPEVEQHRTGGLGDIGHRLAGQHQPDVILRRQHAAGVMELHRFHIAQPEQLRRQAAGRHGIPGDLEEAVATDALRDLVRLR